MRLEVLFEGWFVCFIAVLFSVRHSFVFDLMLLYGWIISFMERYMHAICCLLCLFVAKTRIADS